MPTYEYRCPKGHEFDKFQRMSDPPVAECPECGEKAERLLSTGAGLLFKGSGFYITDYRSEGYKKAAAADKGTSGEGTGGNGSKTPAKKVDAGKPKDTGGSKSGSTAD